MASQETHRSSDWKQTNKKHKTGRHKSNRSIEKLNRGRVSVKVCSKKGLKVQRKFDRLHQMKQARNKARQEVMQKKRAFGAQGAPPILVAVIPLSESQEKYVEETLKSLTSCIPESELIKLDSGVQHLKVPRFKQRFSFVTPRFDSLFEILDATKVCDNVMFLVCPHTGMSERGELILTTVLAQSVPSDPLIVLGSPDEIAPNKLNEAKKLMVKALDRKFPVEKVLTVQNEGEATNIMRTIGLQKRKESVMRGGKRASILAESVKYCPGEDTGSGCLELTGFVREADLCVDRLVHVPGLGDFQIDRIEKLKDPCSLVSRSNEMQDSIILHGGDNQQDLETENVPDYMDGEQTWPTEDELQEAEKAQEGFAKPLSKKVPKGTSEYQAAWILEDENDENDDGEDDFDDDDDDMGEMPPPAGDDLSDEGEEHMEDAMETMSVTASTVGDRDTEDYDKKHVNFDDEVLELERIKQERIEAMFPDEVDTPADIAARIRFQKFRGLKSFRSSKWDSKENLPADYARIFQFENFRRTRKRVLNEEMEEGRYVDVGCYVKVVLKNVGAHLRPQFEGRMLCLTALLPHEQRMSVINLAVRRAQISHKLPVQSKANLVFQCGWRRFGAQPIFSSHTNGSKHKYERYFREGSSIVMTTYAPIMFPPAPVLVFQDLPGQGHTLLATGTLLDINPDRMVIKRTILSGHPFKVHKRSATVRFMFFNREDIMWFKPIELRTKQGRRGHIKEPLGTHGHMKCIFDGQLSQQDTVMLHLFKRVFPKWNYDPYPEDVEITALNKKHDQMME